MKYSVIIPTLNEESNLRRQLTFFGNIKEEIELIICDGGSTDKTPAIAQSSGAVYCNSTNGRGIQQNQGARIAAGKFLIFLHADTFLPQNAFEIIDRYFSNTNVKLATFSLQFDVRNLLLRLYTKFTKFDSLFTSFGDQVIVIRRNFFEQLGMFPNQKIMEDVELLRRARKITKIYKLPASVLTSSRRFLKKGIIKTQFLSAWFLIQYLLGKDSNAIYKKYYILEK